MEQNYVECVPGKKDEAVYYPPVYFDNRYEDERITDKRSVEIIRDVDKSDVVSTHLIESPVLGPISPKELSGGVKTILLMRKMFLLIQKNSLLQFRIQIIIMC